MKGNDVNFQKNTVFRDFATMQNFENLKNLKNLKFFCGFFCFSISAQKEMKIRTRDHARSIGRVPSGPVRAHRMIPLVKKSYVAYESYGHGNACSSAKGPARRFFALFFGVCEFARATLGSFFAGC